MYCISLAVPIRPQQGYPRRNIAQAKDYGKDERFAVWGVPELLAADTTCTKEVFKGWTGMEFSLLQIDAEMLTGLHSNQLSHQMARSSDQFVLPTSMGYIRTHKFFAFEPDGSIAPLSTSWWRSAATAKSTQGGKLRGSRQPESIPWP